MVKMEMVLKDSLIRAGVKEELPIELCNQCGEELEKDVELFGRVSRVRKICSCALRRREEKEKADGERERRIYLNRMMKNSYLEDKFKDATFSNWNHEKGDEKLYRVSIKYAMGYRKIIDENIGLLFTGKPGGGKSFAVACITNYMLVHGVSAVCISINKFLDRIKETYGFDEGVHEDNVIREVCSAEVLIIDDLGSELRNEWGSSRVYRIIDERYRMGLPTIITTNLSLSMLKGRYDERVYDRIREMCVSVVCSGGSIRERVNSEKVASFQGIIFG